MKLRKESEIMHLIARFFDENQLEKICVEKCFSERNFDC